MTQHQAMKAAPSRRTDSGQSLRLPAISVSAPDRWMELQRGIGNQAVGRLMRRHIGPGRVLQRKCACGGESTGSSGECEECRAKKMTLQAKLRIGASHDIYEQEADRVAEQVTQGATHADIAAAPLRIQRLPEQGSSEADTPASVGDALAQPGEPLSLSLRRDMEQRFGHDFSRVRVHYDAQAMRSAGEVNARAYTVGHDIVFGAGQFAPATRQGRRLLGHELTHVVQQTNGTACSAAPGAAHEREANSVVGALEAGRAPQISIPSRIGLAAKPDSDASDPGPPHPKIIRRSDIEARVRRVMHAPAFAASQAHQDFNASPRLAKANLYQSHFRDDHERLSYALGFFRTLLGMDGTGVNEEQLVAALVDYEAQIEGQTADLVIHSPPTEAERKRLDQMQQQIDQWRAARARREREARLKRLADRTPATRAERYDANLERQGKSPSYPGFNVDVDPSLLTPDEFREEWTARGKREMQACIDEGGRQGTIERCKLAVKEKYMGKQYMEDSFAQVRARWNEGAYIEAIKNSGPLGLGGRIIGRSAGYLIAGDEGADIGEGWGALAGDFGDIATAVGVGMYERGRLANYEGSAGLEVYRDAPVELSYTRPSEGRAAQPATRAEQLREIVGESKPLFEPIRSGGTAFDPSQPVELTSPSVSPPPQNFREALDRVDISKMDPAHVASLRQDYQQDYSKQPNPRLKTEDDYVRYRGGKESGQWQEPVGEGGEFQLHPALGRAHEGEWSAWSGSPRNPGERNGGRFRTPWGNVEPDFAPSVDGNGNQIFTRAPSGLSTSDSNTAWDAALRSGWNPLLMADSKHFQSGVHGLTDQLRGFIWLARYTQSQTFVIVGREGDQLTADIQTFASQQGVTILIKPFGR